LDVTEILYLCYLCLVLDEFLNELQSLLAINCAVTLLGEVVITVSRQNLRAKFLSITDVLAGCCTELSIALHLEIILYLVNGRLISNTAGAYVTRASMEGDLSHACLDAWQLREQLQGLLFVFEWDLMVVTAFVKRKWFFEPTVDILVVEFSDHGILNFLL
jgi:hypothetical protein